MNIVKTIQIHRFNDYLAISINGQNTFYMPINDKLLTDFMVVLATGTLDIVQHDFKDSTFSSTEINFNEDLYNDKHTS